MIVAMHTRMIALGNNLGIHRKSRRIIIFIPGADTFYRINDKCTYNYYKYDYKEYWENKFNKSKHYNFTPEALLQEHGLYSDYLQ